MATTWPAPARSLIGSPVRLGAVQLGVVVDVIASDGLGHVLGFEVRGRDALAHFLPWVAAEAGGESLEVRSVYSLLSPAELPVYLERGVRLREQPDDLLVDRHGDVVAVVSRGAAPAPSAGDARRPAA